jgi:hypothetical protein
MSQQNKEQDKQFVCECGKVYKLNSGLYKHKKTCNEDVTYMNSISINDFTNEIQKQQELIAILTAENSKLKQAITGRGSSVHFLAD